MYIVNLAVMVAGIAIIAVGIAAPIHAYYRNSINPNDRTYYRLAAAELTKRWHAAVGKPLTRISGDDGLAFAMAFYSPDHPVYSRPFQFQYTWGMPRPVTLQKGWAAMCMADDLACLGWMSRVAETAEQPLRFDFEVQPTLWGRPGIPATIAALMVLPRGVEATAPGPLSEGVEDFSSSHRQ